MTHTHHTAPTRFLESNGVRFAYRRFGTSSGTPLLFLQHFTGTLDSWDPTLTDGFARERDVILFDNAGVSRSSGVTPSSVSAMANDAVAFIGALHLARVDLLGFSLGGFVAQMLATRHPSIIRRMILAGTGPQGGEGIAKLEQVLAEGVTASPDEPRLFLFFEQTESSQAAGRAFISRQARRVVDRDPDISAQSFRAQLDAIVQWGASTSPDATARPEDIRQPVLIVNGKRDVMVPTTNSYELFRRLPNATTILYPDSGHGALFQYADSIIDEGLRFLTEDTLFPDLRPAQSTPLSTSGQTQLR